eukprot:g11522.t1
MPLGKKLGDFLSDDVALHIVGALMFGGTLPCAAFAATVTSLLGLKISKTFLLRARARGVEYIKRFQQERLRSVAAEDPLAPVVLRLGHDGTPLGVTESAGSAAQGHHKHSSEVFITTCRVAVRSAAWVSSKLVKIPVDVITLGKKTAGHVWPHLEGVVEAVEKLVCGCNMAKMRPFVVYNVMDSGGAARRLRRVFRFWAGFAKDGRRPMKKTAAASQYCGYHFTQLALLDEVRGTIGRGEAMKVWSHRLYEVREWVGRIFAPLHTVWGVGGFSFSVGEQIGADDAVSVMHRLLRGCVKAKHRNGADRFSPSVRFWPQEMKLVGTSIEEVASTLDLVICKLIVGTDSRWLSLGRCCGLLILFDLFGGRHLVKLKDDGFRDSLAKTWDAVIDKTALLVFLVCRPADAVMVEILRREGLLPGETLRSRLESLIRIAWDEAGEVLNALGALGERVDLDLAAAGTVRVAMRLRKRLYDIDADGVLVPLLDLVDERAPASAFETFRATDFGGGWDEIQILIDSQLVNLAKTIAENFTIGTKGEESQHAIGSKKVGLHSHRRTVEGLAQEIIIPQFAVELGGIGGAVLKTARRVAKNPDKASGRSLYIGGQISAAMTALKVRRPEVMAPEQGQARSHFAREQFRIAADNWNKESAATKKMWNEAGPKRQRVESGQAAGTSSTPAAAAPKADTHAGGTFFVEGLGVATVRYAHDPDEEQMKKRNPGLPQLPVPLSKLREYWVETDEQILEKRRAACKTPPPWTNTQLQREFAQEALPPATPLGKLERRFLLAEDQNRGGRLFGLLFGRQSGQHEAASAASRSAQNSLTPTALRLYSMCTTEGHKRGVCFMQMDLVPSRKGIPEVCARLPTADRCRTVPVRDVFSDFNRQTEDWWFGRMSFDPAAGLFCLSWAECRASQLPELPPEEEGEEDGDSGSSEDQTDSEDEEVRELLFVKEVRERELRDFLPNNYTARLNGGLWLRAQTRKGAAGHQTWMPDEGLIYSSHTVFGPAEAHRSIGLQLSKSFDLHKHGGLTVCYHLCAAWGRAAAFVVRTANEESPPPGFDDVQNIRRAMEEEIEEELLYLQAATSDPDPTEAEQAAGKEPALTAAQIQQRSTVAVDREILGELSNRKGTMSGDLTIEEIEEALKNKQQARNKKNASAKTKADRVKLASDNLMRKNYTVTPGNVAAYWKIRGTAKKVSEQRWDLFASLPLGSDGVTRIYSTDAIDRWRAVKSSKVKQLGKKDFLHKLETAWKTVAPKSIRATIAPASMGGSAELFSEGAVASDADMSVGLGGGSANAAEAAEELEGSERSFGARTPAGSDRDDMDVDEVEEERDDEVAGLGDEDEDLDFDDMGFPIGRARREILDEIHDRDESSVGRDHDGEAATAAADGEAGVAALTSSKEPATAATRVGVDSNTTPAGASSSTSGATATYGSTLLSSAAVSNTSTHAGVEEEVFVIPKSISRSMWTDEEKLQFPLTVAALERDAKQFRAYEVAILFKYEEFAPLGNAILAKMYRTAPLVKAFAVQTEFMRNIPTAKYLCWLDHAKEGFNGDGLPKPLEYLYESDPELLKAYEDSRGRVAKERMTKALKNNASIDQVGRIFNLAKQTMKEQAPYLYEGAAVSNRWAEVPELALTVGTTKRELQDQGCELEGHDLEPQFLMNNSIRVRTTDATTAPGLSKLLNRLNALHANDVPFEKFRKKIVGQVETLLEEAKDKLKAVVSKVLSCNSIRNYRELTECKELPGQLVMAANTFAHDNFTVRRATRALAYLGVIDDHREELPKDACNFVFLSCGDSIFTAALNKLAGRELSLDAPEILRKLCKATGDNLQDWEDDKLQKYEEFIDRVRTKCPQFCTQTELTHLTALAQIMTETRAERLRVAKAGVKINKRNKGKEGAEEDDDANAHLPAKKRRAAAEKKQNLQIAKAAAAQLQNNNAASSSSSALGGAGSAFGADPKNKDIFSDELEDLFRA